MAVPNLVFAAAAVGCLLVLIVWMLKRRGKEKTPICKDDIKWWREL